MALITFGAQRGHFSGTARARTPLAGIFALLLLASVPPVVRAAPAKKPASTAPAPKAAKPASTPPTRTGKPQAAAQMKASASASAAPAAPATAVAAGKPPKPDKLSVPPEDPPVNENGPVGLEELIQLALFYDPEVVDMRGRVEVAQARRKAATDLRDPDLRVTYGTDTDVQLGAPYHESSTSYSRYSGSEFQRDTTVGNGEYRIDNERTRYSESRYRHIERTVIPGRYQDRIIETEYDSRSTSNRGSRNRTNFDDKGLAGRRDDISSQENRRIVGRTVTTRTHPDAQATPENFGLLLRLPIPNPFQMRAMVAAAEAQIKQADYALRAAETKVTLDVQDLYQRLAYYSALRDRHERLQKHREKFVDMANATMLQKVPAAVDNAYSAAADVFDATMRVERLRGELAAICGLRNPDRIAVPKTFTQRYIDADKLELDWLIQMAGIYRSDLQQLHARYDAARAEYRAERAKEIPALLSIDVGWERQWDGFGRHDKDEFVVRGIFSLPLWSWLINDEKEIPAAEARNYSRQIGRMNNRIVAEVDAALRGLRAAQRMLAKYEQHRAGVNLMAKNAGLAIASSDKPQELMSEAQEIGMKLDIGELEVRRHYNERLLDLEKALGTRLDSLLRQGNP